MAVMESGEAASQTNLSPPPARQKKLGAFAVTFHEKHVRSIQSPTRKRHSASTKKECPRFTAQISFLLPFYILIFILIAAKDFRSEY